MPLKDFIAETMRIIQSEPRAREICVEGVKPLRFAEANGAYHSVFEGLGRMVLNRDPE
jgi:uncharacterized oxidoreductase